MSLEQDLESIDLNIANEEQALKLCDALTRLGKNKDWKLLIDKHYLVVHASELVGLSESPHVAKARDDIMSSIVGVGRFRQFLSGVARNGDTAAESVKSHKELREQLLANGEEV